LLDSLLQEIKRGLKREADQKSSGFHTNMKVFLFSLLVAAACAQRGAFLQELINGDL